MNRLLQYIREVLYLLGDNRRKIPWMLFLFLASSVLDLAGISLIAPYVAILVSPETFTQSNFYPFFVSLGMVTEQEELLTTLGLLLLSVFVFKAVAAILINLIIVRFCYKQGIHLRLLLMTSYQNLPYIHYLHRNSSEFVHNIALAGKFSESILQSILRLISDGLVALVILVLLALNNPIALGLLVLLLGSLIFIYDQIFRPNIGRYGRQSNEYSTQMVKSIHEGIEGLKEIRILGKEKHFQRMLHEGAKGYASVSTKSAMITTSPRYLLEFLLVAFVVFTVFISIMLGEDLKSLLPTLGMFGIASLRLVPAANQILSGITKIRFGRNSVALLYSDLQYLEQQVNLDNETIRTNVSAFQLLSLYNVSFSYPSTQQQALNDVSLEINKGDAIGLTGPSGSGKTTFVDILLGLMKPQSGEINFNGQPLSNNLSEWRSQVAYLPQQVFLIDSSLRNNVALGLDEHEIDDEKVEEALRQARLSDLVKQLPQGFDTMLGERGIRLSGGQRQRVALARAFYHDRNVLVMDESTSSLDNETEREIVEEIKRLKGNKTLIIIAHRLTTLQHCNRIYQLERGGLVKQGSYEDVVGVFPR